MWQCGKHKLIRLSVISSQIVVVEIYCDFLCVCQKYPQPIAFVYTTDVNVKIGFRHKILQWTGMIIRPEYVT